MSLIVSQTPVNRLPAELVNNAAFVKQVDFDPVHQTAETGQPAEKSHGSVLPRFDTLSISAEALARAKDVQRLSFADGTDVLSLDAEADISQPIQQRPSVIDITDPVSVERKKQGDAMGRAMKSWNSLMGQLKQESESGGYDYFKTIRLFRSRSAEWEKDLQQTDPEAYQMWLDKFKNVVYSQKEE